MPELYYGQFDDLGALWANLHDETTRLKFLLFTFAKNEATRVARYMDNGRQFSSASDDFLKKEYLEEMRMWSEADLSHYDLMRLDDLQTELEIRQIETGGAEVRRYLDMLAAKAEELYADKDHPKRDWVDEALEAYEARDESNY